MRTILILGLVRSHLVLHIRGKKMELCWMCPRGKSLYVSFNLFFSSYMAILFNSLELAGSRCIICGMYRDRNPTFREEGEFLRSRVTLHSLY